jgi:hypothetical protein
MKSRLIILGGVIHILFVMFHLTFYQQFNWQEDLQSLSADNYGILLTLHMGVIFLFAAIGLISFLLREKLVTTDAGKAFSLMIAAFYGVRILAQFLYFPKDNLLTTIAIVVICAAAGLAYLIPVLIDRRQPAVLPA